MTRQQRMQTALSAAFAPLALEVVDDSARHHGHGGARPEGETHYTIHIIAPAFAGLSRLARHRAVNEAIAAEFKSGLHALAINAKAPGEA